MINLRKISGALIVVFSALLVVAIFISLLNVSDIQTSSALKPDIFLLVSKSAFQAFLSVVFSLLFGVLLAWSLNRLSFFGRNLLIGLYAAAIVMPAIIIAVGVIGIWGRAGFVNQMFEIVGFGKIGSIFGLHGIVLAHTILSGAFAARVFLTRLDAIPAKALKIGQNLRFGAWLRFKTLDLPAMVGALPTLSVIIFLLSFTSFPIVLLLGGGPDNQTLEVAIYSAVRLNFDLNSAVQMALIQLGISFIIILPAIFYLPTIIDIEKTPKQKWFDEKPVIFFQAGILIFGTLLFLSPLLSVLFDGFSRNAYLIFFKSSFWNAFFISIIIGILSAILNLFFTFGLCFARAEIKNKTMRAIFYLPVFAFMIVPSVVLSLGFFISVQNLGLEPVFAAPFVLILANALLVLPFSVATLSPPIEAANKKYSRVIKTLKLSGLRRFKTIELPMFGKEIGLVLALSFCFSLGDLGIISLFGTEDFATLPWLMVRAMGAYRNNDAQSIAAIMLILTLVVFWLLPKMIKRISDA